MKRSLTGVPLSIVVPLLNEEGNLEFLCNSLNGILRGRFPDWEIIFVDDGSQDGSWQKIIELHKKDRKVRGISLSRNFGHQSALLAGLEAAIGEAVVTMDADLQHPPEMVLSLYEKHLEGYDMVNTSRKYAGKEAMRKRFFSGIYYRLLNLLSEFPIQPYSSDFRLMSRRAVDTFVGLPERDRFNRGLVSWMGFRQTAIPYDAPARHSGKSKYTMRRMMHLGVSGIASFSSRPLRISFYLGLLIFVLGFLYALYAIWQHVTGNTIPGWTSILVSVLIIGGIQLLSLGVIGEYIARIFNEVKGRPNFIIRQEVPERDQPG